MLFTHLAKRKSVVSGDSSGVAADLLAQRLSIALHSENARAILRRLTGTDADALLPRLDAAGVLLREGAEHHSNA